MDSIWGVTYHRFDFDLMYRGVMEQSRGVPTKINGVSARQGEHERDEINLKLENIIISLAQFFFNIIPSF